MCVFIFMYLLQKYRIEGGVALVRCDYMKRRTVEIKPHKCLMTKKRKEKEIY